MEIAFLPRSSFSAASGAHGLVTVQQSAPEEKTRTTLQGRLAQARSLGACGAMERGMAGVSAGESLLGQHDAHAGSRLRHPARRSTCSLTASALVVSAALNAACLTLLVHSGLGAGGGAPRRTALAQTLPMMEAALRQRARPAEEQLRRMQARAKPAAPARARGSKARGQSQSTVKPPSPASGRFSLRTLDKEMKRDQKLDHAAPKPSSTLEGAQQLSGVHAEAQFNWQGTTFGRLEPRIANETEPEEAEEDPEPEFMEDAPPGALSFTGKDCSPTEIIGGTGVPNPYDAVFPEELNQITIEAWVKDCNLIDFNGYIGLHDVRNAPVRARRRVRACLAFCACTVLRCVARAHAGVCHGSINPDTDSNRNRNRSKNGNHPTLTHPNPTLWAW